jgi:hypothetical protein
MEHPRVLIDVSADIGTIKEKIRNIENDIHEILEVHALIKELIGKWETSKPKHP